MSDDQLGEEQPLIAHLLELRTRLLRIVIGILLVFLPMAYFARDLFTFLSGPLLAHMPEGNSLIATGVAACFTDLALDCWEAPVIGDSG